MIPLLIGTALLASLPTSVMAIGGASGAAIDYPVQGQIGEVVMNPYNIAPLTAVIKNGGYMIKDVNVRIVPKEGGQEISYTVADRHLLTHGGIPVFGLYPDYTNTVEVEYTRLFGDKEEKVKESYKLRTPGIYTDVDGQSQPMFSTSVKKVAPEFKDRLYFVNNLMEKSGKRDKSCVEQPYWWRTRVELLSA